MAFDAEPTSPAAEDPPADDAMDAEPEGKEEAGAEEKQEEAEEQEEEEEEESQTERKRGRRKKGSAEKPAPATPTVERPSRERKTVERYAELTPRVTPAKKASAILQGPGTKLKDIPNGKGKGSTAAGSTPTTKQLHAVVSDILNPQPFSVSGRWQSAMTAAAEADGGRKADVLVRDDAPKLLAALKEMKDGLDLVRSKVESLTRKVRKNQLPTCDGIGYLEAKHHLLLSYCQGLVYYLLRKAKGLSVDGHPVVCSLVEIRLFLEKIRAIDKKMEYQIQKLTNAAEGAAAQEKVLNAEVKGKGEQRGEEDLLKYRPNPDMMDSKFAPDGQDNDGLYRPPKFVPASMDDKHQKDASRRDRALARMATENPYIKEIIDDAADRPEEWKETVGDESKEFVNYMRQREKQEKQEEELFTRAPVTKREKYMEKQMKEQLHGLRGLTDGFDLGMNMLLDGDKEDGGGSCEPHGKSVGRRKHQKGKKRKRH